MKPGTDLRSIDLRHKQKSAKRLIVRPGAEKIVKQPPRSANAA